ncbi:MAG: M15 family metallopeptidase [Christensenellaceae bacterium]|nr:M15 family metallopeptidase [Christensenellaceae bacterium]
MDLRRFKKTALIVLVLLALCSCGKKKKVSSLPASSLNAAGPAVSAFDPESGSAENRRVSIVFTQDSRYPLPENGEVLSLGEKRLMGGIIESNRPLKSVKVTVTCMYNRMPVYPYEKEVSFDSGDVYLYDMSKDEHGTPLTDMIDTAELSVGVHTVTVSALAEGQKRHKELFKGRFYIAGDQWEQIDENDFPDSYPEALAFFGSTDKFLYRYQWVYDRYIMADPDWEKSNITEISAYPSMEKWKVHKDALPYMKEALRFLETSYVRVSGTNGDTGVIRASELIDDYNGCYVARFTSSLVSISHHAFGTAVDINADMEPNTNSLDNKQLIDDDVNNNLIYNGIKEENGIPYYDYTYTGEWETEKNGVPMTVINYLLYELGFYRAGFDWGHYYKGTSDAMHFCLTEHVTFNHDGESGLRKVFEYADPVD